MCTPKTQAINMSLKYFYLIPLLALLLLSGSMARADNRAPRVHLQTNQGEIVLELYPDKAPLTVENFLRYARDGFYDGTLFHRVIDGFMIQGGGFTGDFKRKKTRAGVRNEADNGLKNVRGSIAMARTMDPHSATSQFFINLVDNDFLNFRHPTSRGWGYTVFGKVVSGMDVVDRIGGLTTGPGGPFPKDVPKQRVMIDKVFVEETDGGQL